MNFEGAKPIVIPRYGSSCQWDDEVNLPLGLATVAQNVRYTAQSVAARFGHSTQLLKLVAPAEVAADFENRLRAGGFGYGDLKKGLFDHYWSHFAEARQRRTELAANRDYVNQVLTAGAVKARTLAQTVLKRARKASGLE